MDHSPDDELYSLSKRHIIIKPMPGACIKSVTTKDWTIDNLSRSLFSVSDEAIMNDLDKFVSTHPISKKKSLKIPKGTKTFVNIAWDKGFAPPPPASEEIIRRAVFGQDDDGNVVENEDRYYIPTNASKPRQVKDKAGNVSIVIDSIYHISLKKRYEENVYMRTYIIGMSFNHIEDTLGMYLSRDYTSPNIACKGALEIRSITLPNIFFQTDELDINEINRRYKLYLSNSLSGFTPKPQDKSEKLDPSYTISHAAGAQKDQAEDEDEQEAEDENETPDEKELAKLPPPHIHWANLGGQIRMELLVTKLTFKLYQKTTLLVGPRHLTLHVPKTYYLDMNLDLPDSDLGKVGSRRLKSNQSDADADAPINAEVLKAKAYNASQILRLKRERAIDVEGMTAEWLVDQNVLVLWL